MTAFASAAVEPPPPAPQLELKVESGERWWGGRVGDARYMPYLETSRFARNLAGNLNGNQSQPLLVSTHGRYLWSEEPFRFEFADGVLRITEARGELKNGSAGKSLREASLSAARQFFPADGGIPAELMFTHPQYNTWIELMYDQNQADVLRYARAIIEQGYPPGVLMIDDNWQSDYGRWQFDHKKFPDPKAMIAELHQLGFRVMLWVCPYVSPDSDVYRDLAKRNLLVREPLKPGAKQSEPAIIRWWNGASAALDLTHPEGLAWFRGQLDALMKDYGVDGFKFDAGEAEHYPPGLLAHNASQPHDHTRAFVELGLHYPYNEYRSTWKLAGRALAQRLKDKGHNWRDLQGLIPSILTQGIIGYAFTCPDMIGGGEFTSFLNASRIDEELVVRSAQVHALMPMMQFSAAPWRVLSPQNNAICRDMARLHVKYGSRIIELAREAAKTGEPIVRPLCWEWPGAGYEDVRDQFMLGADILVAPVVERGARSRQVLIPPGQWRADDGAVFTGPLAVEIKVPLERLPHFERVKP